MNQRSPDVTRSGRARKSIRVLLVEDDENDAEFTVIHLQEYGYDPVWKRVQTAETMRAALHEAWDVIVSDYTMPRFSAPDALDVLNSTGLDIPFVIVSGSIGAEKAAPLMRAGAKDFVVKGDLGRLVPIIERERKEAEGRQARERAERLAKESDERFRLFVEGVKDYAIMMLNPEGNLVSWNLGAERLLGYKEAEVLHGPMHNFFASEDGQTQIQIDLTKAVTDGSASGDRWYVRKDGSRFWANAVLTALRDDGQNLRGFSQIMRDLTVEEDLREQKEQLSRSNAELERYAYVASHDLKEPLRMVSMYVMLLKDQYAGKVLDGEADAYMATIVEGANRMRSLIDDLLSISKLTETKSGVESVDCERLMPEVLAALELQIRELGAVVSHGPLPTVRGDATQIKQLLQNLLHNALKFHHTSAPRVHVAVEDAEDMWKFSVRDNGLGIDPAYWDKVFVIFQRLHADRRQYPGTGIGLAVCKKIVERHRGRIWLESVPQQGSTFYFTLPKQT